MELQQHRPLWSGQMQAYSLLPFPSCLIFTPTLKWEPLYWFDFFFFFSKGKRMDSQASWVRDLTLHLFSKQKEIFLSNHREIKTKKGIGMTQMRECLLGCFSCVQLIVTLQTIACQAPLSMGFSRQEYWSGLPCLHPGDLPNPGIEPVSLMSPALAGRFLTTSATGEPYDSDRNEWTYTIWTVIERNLK